VANINLNLVFSSQNMNVGPVLMVGMKQHFVQAAPIKYLCTFCALREVLPVFERKLFVFVGCHCLVLTHSFRSASLNAMVRSSLPVESKT
jgi:hypothetical protein